MTTLFDTLVGGYLQLLQFFIRLVTAPLEHPPLIWMVLPIYTSWFLAETFHKFSRDDIILNANTCFWVAILWGKQSLDLISKGISYGQLGFAAAVFMLVYGVILVYIFITENDWLAKFLARTREVALVQILLTPIVYYPQEYIKMLGSDAISASITLFAIGVIFLPFAHIFGIAMGFIGKKLFKSWIEQRANV